jgi:lysophospholipase L1-like esterase
MLLLAGLALSFALLSLEAAAEPRIVWRLENGFRFFTDPKLTEAHRATYEALSEQERQTPILSAERALAERHGRDGWAATMLDQTCWDHASNRHRCRGEPGYLHPRLHKIQTSLAGVPDAAAIDCTWLTASRGEPSSALTVPCDVSVKLEIPYPDGAAVRVQVGGQTVARSDVRVEDVLVVGIGDSFGSGEGNPDVPVRFSRERAADYGDPDKEPQFAGYPARTGNWRTIGDADFIKANPRWLDQACHRSLYSHQLRVALQLAIENPQRAVTFVSFACSGAEIVRGLFLRYRGHEWVPTPPDLSQISAVAQEQCGEHRAPSRDLPEAYHMQGKVPELEGGLVLRKCDVELSRKIDLVLVSIGGNDIGFSRLVANAVLADESLLKRLGGWIGQVHGYSEAQRQLSVLEERYKALNRALHNVLHIPWKQADRIVLVSYPALTLLDDGRSVCPDSRAGMTVASDFALSERKARDSMAAADRLDGIMRRTSSAHGWTYVGAHRARFNGRSICAGWIESAISTADDLRLPRKIDGEWKPYNPANYQPYASRQRWFRTPNDAYLSGHFHVSQSILQKALPTKTVNWFQVLLASLYSGAFHPTAEGQAAIADAVVVEARRILGRYADGAGER